MKTYTKEDLINKFIEIKNQGWIMSARHGNQGGVGNTLEDLLGIEENNLPIPNASEWELKSQRKNTTSLITLLHSEPSPRAIRFVSQILLLKYGWPHTEAGKKYPLNEMSFRQTINCVSYSDRGFKVVVDREQSKILISFNYQQVSDRHSDWLKNVENIIGLNELEPQPYWGFDDLHHAVATKLLNCFYVLADNKRVKGKEYFLYDEVYMLQKFSFERFLNALESGYVYVDFDARTGHNHGTKFRLRQNKHPELYEIVKRII